MLAREGDQFVGGSSLAFAQRHIRQDFFTPIAVGLADDAGFRHGWVPVERLLHLLRRDVGPAPHDDFFLASAKPDKTVGVDLHQIAGLEPAVLERRIAPVTDGDARSAYPHLAVDDANLQITERAAQTPG